MCYLPAGGRAGHSLPVVTVSGRGLALLAGSTTPSSAAQQAALVSVYNPLQIAATSPASVSLAGGQAVTLTGELTLCRRLCCILKLCDLCVYR